MFTARADIFCDKVKLSYGHVKHAVLSIFYLDIILNHTVGIEAVDAVENADAVCCVHNVVASVKLV